MHAPDLIALLAHRAGLPALTLSAEGTAALVIDDELTIEFEHDAGGGQLFASALLGALPAQGREAVALELLRAGRFGHDTARAHVGLDGDELLLTQVFDLELTDETRFLAALDALLDAALGLRARIASVAAAVAPADAVVPAFGALLRA